MKIYKPNFLSLLEESVGPVYLQIIKRVNDYSTILLISVTAFNKQGHALEYRIQIGNYLTGMKAERDPVWDKCEAIFTDMKKQLITRERQSLDGIISEELILGDAYKIENKTTDLSQFIGNIEGQPMPKLNEEVPS